MKKTILSLSLAVLTILSVNAGNNENHENLTINTKISSVNWVGKKVSGEHSGTINIKEGSLHLHDGNVASGKIIIDMESINTTDMEGEYKEKLDKHLKETDFFDVANHKTALLNITSVKLIEGNKYKITGDLTIKGIAKPIAFPATIEIKDGKLGAYAEMEVDRTLYDIKYGSGKFFEGLGDKMISDNFIIKFKIAAE